MFEYQKLENLDSMLIRIPSDSVYWLTSQLTATELWIHKLAEETYSNTSAISKGFIDIHIPASPLSHMSICVPEALDGLLSQTFSYTITKL